MFLSTRQMRHFAELVADVIDDMLAADFEDGFAADGELPDAFPGAETAFRELIRTGGPRPYDWHAEEASREVVPIAGWERRHARPATIAALRVRRSRPGQVEATPEYCTAPIRTIGADSTPCH